MFEFVEPTAEDEIPMVCVDASSKLLGLKFSASACALVIFGMPERSNGFSDDSGLLTYCTSCLSSAASEYVESNEWFKILTKKVQA